MKYLKRFNESSSNPEYSNIDITGENFIEIFDDTLKMSDEEIDTISDVWENSNSKTTRTSRLNGRNLGLLEGRIYEGSVCKVEDDWFILIDNRNYRGSGSSLWKCDTINGLLSKIMEIWGHN